MLAAASCILLATRVLTRVLIRRERRRGDDYRIWLIVGRNSRAATIAQDILTNPHYGIRIAEVVDVGAESSGVSMKAAIDAAGQAVLARLPGRRVSKIDDLQAIIGSGVVDEVVLTLPIRSCYDLICQVLEMCKKAGISVKQDPVAFEIPEFGRALTHVGAIPLLTHFSGPSNYPQLIAKRLLDIAISATSLLLLAPFLVFLAFLVRATSAGPVFFRQKRVGLHGRQFSMVKFRSMQADAHHIHHELRAANERDGLAFKIKSDPRITPIGVWLRKFHLDELPQLWNVLVGDMSMVGPRPLPITETTGHEWWQRRRLTVPPGLTCLWQLEDDPTIPFHQWMRMDIDYIDRWSFWLDLKIIVLTFRTLARGRGW
jgi:exopolysaccharide biosynthesis polyprenyl glycosylphosphotransferase